VISEASVLKRMRRLCLALPRASETVTFGHPTFQVEGKSFAVLETYKGELGICIKVGTLLQDIFLKDPRFSRTPYIGKHGWVTLRVYAAPLNWEEIRELLKGSHGLCAVTSSQKPKRGKSRHTL
jgi:predicted DNA-binding protein (MmcQ/YjbR family)